MFALMALFSLTAGAQTDPLYMSIDSLTFVGGKNTSAILKSNSQVLSIDLAQMQSMPKILGNTDPLHVIKMLPGVQTTTEFNSNIYIRGCDAAHNDMTVGGVPMFGINHLMGLFSIFNPSHYPKMDFFNASSSNRLGGTVAMALPDTLSKRVTGDVSVGLVSLQGTVGVRVGKHSHLRASVRRSYLGLLYSKWLKIDENTLKYGFGDYNFTYLYSDGKKNKVWADFYAGCDNAQLYAVRYGVDFKFDWGNYKASVHWSHDGDELQHDHVLYSSGYGARCQLSQVVAELDMPSYIMANGYKGSLRWKDFTSKAELTYYSVLPQTPAITGMANSGEVNVDRQAGVEVSLSTEYEKELSENWGLGAELRGVCYHNPEIGTTWRALPKVSLEYNAYHAGKARFSYGWSQQNLFYTGLSASGLPIEFYFIAGRYSKPQYAQWMDLSYDLRFYKDMLSLSLGLYGKKLYNQAEYGGDLMDLFTASYDLSNSLLHGRGYNYGLNLMLNKQSGKFTGWVSYAWGRAIRKFDESDVIGWVPSNHERIHELNIVGSYKIKKWDVAASFIYATGLPFTAPKSYYLSSGQLVANFGEHNACRMRPYIRMDLSVSYSFIRNEKQENGINLSIVNALGRRNDIMYKLIVRDTYFSYSRQSFMLRIIPSISYYHKF